MSLAARTEERIAPSTLLADYNFELPAASIAQEPNPERDRARMLVLDRRSNRREHARVRDLPRWLKAGDLLVINDTRVLRARVRGQLSSGAKAELLLVHEIEAPASPETATHAPGSVWRCLGKPGKRLGPDARISLFDGVEARVLRRHDDAQIDVWFPIDDVISLLDRFGEVPLPPYIRRGAGPLAGDAERYQTMFAATAGSVAAPTAGLHFTPALVEAIHQVGAQIASLTLHVGPGTFLPVRCDDARDHPMLPERYAIPETTAAQIQAAKRAGGRVIAIGTTTTRALESAAVAGPLTTGRSGWATHFIYPGVPFQLVDALFTNFHLPRSTLLLLVSAFAGRDRVLATYTEAVAHGYRFYSYGDAMLIT